MRNLTIWQCLKIPEIIFFQRWEKDKGRAYYTYHIQRSIIVNQREWLVFLVWLWVSLKYCLKSRQGEPLLHKKKIVIQETTSNKKIEINSQLRIHVTSIWYKDRTEKKSSLRIEQRRNHLSLGKGYTITRGFRFSTIKLEQNMKLLSHSLLPTMIVLIT